MIKEEVAKELQLASKCKDFLLGKINCIDVFLSDIYIDSIGGSYISSRFTGFYSVYKAIRSWFLKHKFKTTSVSDIIFIPVVRNHLDQMIPIARQLTDSGYSVLFLVNKINLIRILAHHAYPIYWLHEPSFSFFSRYKAPNRVLNGVSAEYVQTMWPEWGKKINFYSNAYDHIIHSVTPKIICVGYDITFEGRLACRFFSSKGIPTVCIQHGDMSGMLNSEHIADEFFVYGEAIQQQLSRRNTEGRTKFVVTGAPYLDELELPGITHPKVIPTLLGCPENKPYVLVAFSGPGNNTSLEHHKKLIEAVYTLNKEIPELTLIVKLHPKDRMEHYEEVGQRFPEHTVRVIRNIKGQQLTIFDWLSGCGALLTGASTTAMEALLCGIPVITLDLQQEYNGISFIDRGATVHVTDASALSNEIKKLVYNAAYREDSLKKATPFVEDYFYLRDNHAAKRCAERIERLMLQNSCAE